MPEPSVDIVSQPKIIIRAQSLIRRHLAQKEYTRRLIEKFEQVGIEYSWGFVTGIRMSASTKNLSSNNCEKVPSDMVELTLYRSQFSARSR